MIAPARDAPTKLGEIIAIKDGDRWELASSGACSGNRFEEVICGVEIIAHRMVARAFGAAGSLRLTPRAAGVDRPFFGIYLPAHADNRQAAQRSLIGPDDRFLPGGCRARHRPTRAILISGHQTLERQAGWAWALFNAVRQALAVARARLRGDLG